MANGGKKSDRDLNIGVNLEARVKDAVSKIESAGQKIIGSIAPIVEETNKATSAFGTLSTSFDKLKRSLTTDPFEKVVQNLEEARTKIQALQRQAGKEGGITPQQGQELEFSRQQKGLVETQKAQETLVKKIEAGAKREIAANARVVDAKKASFTEVVGLINKQAKIETTAQTKIQNVYKRRFDALRRIFANVPGAKEAIDKEQAQINQTITTTTAQIEANRLALIKKAATDRVGVVRETLEKVKVLETQASDAQLAKILKDAQRRKKALAGALQAGGLGTGDQALKEYQRQLNEIDQQTKVSYDKRLRTIREGEQKANRARREAHRQLVEEQKRTNFKTEAEVRKSAARQAKLITKAFAGDPAKIKAELRKTVATRKRLIDQVNRDELVRQKAAEQKLRNERVRSRLQTNVRIAKISGDLSRQARLQAGLEIQIEKEKFQKQRISLQQYVDFVKKKKRELAKTQAGFLTTGAGQINIDKERRRLLSLSYGLTHISFQAGLAGAALAAMFAVPIREFARFDSEMAKVRGVLSATFDPSQYEGGVAGLEEQFDRLANAALDLSTKTIFSASKIAEAMKTIAQTGLSAADTLEVLPTVLSFMTAGELDADLATRTLVGSIKAFGLEMKDAGRVADVFTNAAFKTNASLNDIAQGFRFVGGAASGAGISVEETAAVLGLLHRANIRASRSGTAFRRIITKLINPTGDAGKVLKEMGVEVEDAQGNFIGFAEVVRQFNAAMEGSPRQIEIARKALEIFKLRAGPAFLALLQQGADEIERMTSEVGDLGATLRAETERTNSFSGTLARLGNSARALIAVIGGETADDAGFTNLINRLITLINHFRDAIQNSEELRSTLAKLFVGAGITGGLLLVVSVLTRIGALVVSLRSVSLLAFASFKKWVFIPKILGTIVRAIGSIVGATGASRASLVGMTVVAKTGLAGMVANIGAVIARVGLLKAAWLGVSSILPSILVVKAFSDIYKVVKAWRLAEEAKAEALERQVKSLEAIKGEEERIKDLRTVEDFTSLGVDAQRAAIKAVAAEHKKLSIAQQELNSAIELGIGIGKNRLEAQLKLTEVTEDLAKVERLLKEYGEVFHESTRKAAVETKKITKNILIANHTFDQISGNEKEGIVGIKGLLEDKLDILNDTIGAWEGISDARNEAVSVSGFVELFDSLGVLDDSLEGIASQYRDVTNEVQLFGDVSKNVFTSVEKSAGSTALKIFDVSAAREGSQLIEAQINHVVQTERRAAIERAGLIEDFYYRNKFLMQRAIEDTDKLGSEVISDFKLNVEEALKAQNKLVQESTKNVSGLQQAFIKALGNLNDLFESNRNFLKDSVSLDAIKGTVIELEGELKGVPERLDTVWKIWEEKGLDAADSVSAALKGITKDAQKAFRLAADQAKKIFAESTPKEQARLAREIPELFKPLLEGQRKLDILRKTSAEGVRKRQLESLQGAVNNYNKAFELERQLKQAEANRIGERLKFWQNENRERVQFQTQLQNTLSQLNVALDDLSAGIGKRLNEAKFDALLQNFREDVIGPISEEPVLLNYDKTMELLRDKFLNTFKDVEDETKINPLTIEANIKVNEIDVASAIWKGIVDKVNESLPPMLRHQTGGLISGFGGGDSIRALLERGEFVIRKEAVRKYGAGIFAALNNLKLPEVFKGLLGGITKSVSAIPKLGFQTGGPVAGTLGTYTINLNLGGEDVTLFGSESDTNKLLEVLRREEATTV